MCASVKTCTMQHQTFFVFLLNSPCSNTLRARLVCNLSSLNLHYSIFITHHSSLKTPQFPKLPVWHLNSNPVFNFKSCGWVSPKKKIRLSNIGAGYVGLITKMLLKTRFWKLKTPKMYFQFP